jgi:DNA repair ATPase RecN
MSCPVSFTCPIVDNIISNADSISEALNEAHSMIDEMTEIIGGDKLNHLLTSLYDSCNLVSEINDLSESLRSSNEDLRKWGESEECKNKDLEAEVESLQSELEELEE